MHSNCTDSGRTLGDISSTSSPTSATPSDDPLLDAITRSPSLTAASQVAGEHQVEGTEIRALHLFTVIPFIGIDILNGREWALLLSSS